MTSASSRPEPNFEPIPPGRTSHNMVVELDAEALERMRKRADFSGFGGFTIYCDEPEFIGGDNSAPPPLIYFAASILF